MGTFKQGISNAGLRTGNTLVTPLRISGEVVNAVGNIPRQGLSATKNIAEVSKQTRDALIHNLTNFSKVEGKWYQKMLKVPLNLVSAVSRRPAMIAGAGVASGLNQGVRQPFKKLLYTPGKMFKGMRNATRIFNKEKKFDFAAYDTHETKGDTRVHQIQEQNVGFLGAPSGSSKPIEQKKAEEKKPEAKVVAKPVEAKKEPETKEEVKPVIKEKVVEVKKPTEPKKELPEIKKDKAEEKKPEAKPETKEAKPASLPTKSPEKKAQEPGKPKSIDEFKKNEKEKSEKKDKDEQEKRFPERKGLDRREKAKREKEYTKLLDDAPSKEGIVQRGKKEKKGENVEEIITTVKKENPTFAGYMEDEILNKAA